MKVALVCESPLLKKSLTLYLKEHICTYAESDFVISDTKVKSKKPVLYIGNSEASTLAVPFSKEQVLSKAQQFYLYHQEEDEDVKVLETVLAKLNKRHKEKIERIIREYHAKG